LGVPVGGAADRTSLALGNALVGNVPDSAALEIALSGPTLVADAPLACVVFGAPFELASNRQSLHTGKTFTLEAGEELRIGGTNERVRAYVCVRGLLVPKVLGSSSGSGPVRAGERLSCQSATTGVRWFIPPSPPGDDRQTLRTLTGRQADWFASDALTVRTFSVSTESDRMGLRLQSEPLVPPARELLSEPVCPGSVQVVRDGQCIVLGVDGQTIGGYPKIAQVIAADLDKLAQLRPGEEVRFRPVKLEEAETLYRQKQAALREWVTRLRTAVERD
jgi:biotin-dependent carboxylase-like uncharacterized protein